MVVQTDYSGYLQETPEFAEGPEFAEVPEGYVGEYPYPTPSPYGSSYQYPGQSMPFMPGATFSPFSSMPFTPGATLSPFSSIGGQPAWWRWPIIHWSWVNQFRPWRQPPFLSFWRLRQPFEQSAYDRQMALMRYQQQQGMAPGMPGAPYPGMPGAPYPGMPGAPGLPGFPGQPFPGAAGMVGRRRRRRRRR